MRTRQQFKDENVVNAQLRLSRGGQQGLLRGAANSKPDMMKNVVPNYIKKRDDLEGKPTKFKATDVRVNEYRARNKDLAGKQTSKDFRGDKPRFDPMEVRQELVGGASYSNGNYRGGEGNKEVNNRYERPLGTARRGAVNPFPIRIKSIGSLQK